MGGIALKAFSKSRGMSSNDSGKIQRIMSLSGLNVRDGKDTLTTQLVKKNSMNGDGNTNSGSPLDVRSLIMKSSSMSLRMG